jgi:prolipoprotein diacylglyceryltransferase
VLSFARRKAPLPMWQVIYRIPWTVFGWFPDGVPIYGFGLMLFVAFIVCNWLTGRRAARMVQSNIGLGRYVAGPKKGENFPGGDKVEDQVEAAKALVQDLAIWLFVTGLVGARIAYMSHQREGGFWAVLRDVGGDTWGFLGRLIDITNGGIILYGSIIGALVGYGLFCAYLYFRRQAVLNTLRIADLAAPALALGIGLGRVGCLLNGCCYGHVACASCAAAPEVRFPLSAPPRYALVAEGYQTAAGFTLVRDDRLGENIVVDAVDPQSPAYAAGLRPGQVIGEANGKRVDRSSFTALLRGEWPRGKNDLTLKVADDGEEKVIGPFRPKTLGLYPTQAFETVSMALLFLLLTAFFAYRSRDGQVIALLMMCYAVHRTLNELLRDDVRPVGFEKYSSYFLFAAGAALMVWATRRPKEYVSEWELK